MAAIRLWDLFSILSSVKGIAEAKKAREVKVPGGTLLGQYTLATLDGMLVRSVHI